MFTRLRLSEPLQGVPCFARRGASICPLSSSTFRNDFDEYLMIDEEQGV